MDTQITTPINLSNTSLKGIKIFFFYTHSLDSQIYFYFMKQQGTTKKPSPTMQNNLEMVFPLVYGKYSKDNEVAVELFEMFRELIQNEQQLSKYMNIDPKDRDRVVSKLAKSKKSFGNSTTGIYLKFMCAYGCALILSKQRKQSPISLELIVPDEWSTGAKSASEQLEFCEPKHYNSIFTPQLLSYDRTLNEITAKFENKLEQVMSKQTNMNSLLLFQFKKYSPKEIERAIKQALKDKTFKTKDQNNEEDQEQGQILKPQEISEDDGVNEGQQDGQDEKEVINTMNTQAIQYNNSNVHLSWYVPEALIRKLFWDPSNLSKSRIRCDKFLISFKTYILQKTIRIKLSEKKEVKREEISNLKKCLDEIINSYKFTVSAHLNDDQKFLNKLVEINKWIIELNGGRTTTMIEDVDPSKLGQIKLPPPGTVKIHKPQAIAYKNQPPRFVRIQQYNYKINSRFPFQGLLELYASKLGSPQWGKMSDEKKFAFLDHWVLMVQKTLFKIAFLIGQKDAAGPVIDLDIHMREIQCELGATSICNLVLLYENVVNLNDSHFGMDLKSQTKSHIELIKTICGVIAFQSVKLNRQKKKSSLSKYKVPFDIQKLHRNFISHNRLARRAMKSMYTYYQKREGLAKLFQLNGKSDSFAEFGKAVGEETRSGHVWLAYAQRMLKLQKQKIQQTVKLQQAKSKQNVRNGNCIVDQPLQEYAETEKWLYAFAHSVPPDILGLIKILVLAQNPKQSPPTTDLMKDNQFQILGSIEAIKKQGLPIRFHNLKPPGLPQTKTVNFGSIVIADQVLHSEPKNAIKIIYGNSDQAGGITEDMFRKYDKQENVQLENKQCEDQKKRNSLSLIKFLEPPSDKNLSREHDVYAHQFLRHKNTEVEEFLSLFTTRAAEETEIIALCSNIINRRITANCYDTGYRIREQVFLQAAGQLWSYKDKSEKYFGIIKKLLKEYIDVWVYSDTNFSPIIGPFLSYLSDEIKDTLTAKEKQEANKIPLRLAKRCWGEFERVQEQYKLDSSLQVSWDQRFIITGAICCFRQIELTIENTEEIMFLARLIFQYRICKMFSDREKKPQNKRDFEKQKAFSITQAVFMNIEIISTYFQKNPKKLTETVKLFDESIPIDITWKRNGIYEFVGQYPTTGDSYQVDIYRGNLFKNGSQVSSLTPVIKGTKEFSDVFGDKGEFQVYPSSAGYLRTKDMVNHYFKVDKSSFEIYFEFSTDGKKIRYVTRKPAKTGEKPVEQYWQLIPKQQLNNLDDKQYVNLPKLYQEAYYAWYCDSRKCMVFRKNKLFSIYDIGLVIHVKELTVKQFHITKAFQVAYHGSYENQNLEKICDIKNTQFEELVLRSKEHRLNSFLPYKYLQRIQSSQYILEIKNQKSKQQETYFLLHRFQLRFKLIHKLNKIASESYYGYFIDFSYYENKACIFNKFPCLVLKKDEDNEMLLSYHKRILIVSDGIVNADGKIQKISANKNRNPTADTHLNSFRYDVHDFFGDIRGPTRQSQLHLASIMLSIDDNIRMGAIQMTPLEYAMNLLKTCFTNRPFTEQQRSKLKNIIKLAMGLSDQVLLLCQIIWKGSQKLSQILPFTQNTKWYVFEKGMEDYLLQVRTLYTKKIQKGKLSYRQKMNSNFLKFISAGSSENEDQYGSYQAEEYWKNNQYTGASLPEKTQNFNKDYKKICEQYKKINLMMKKYPPLNQKSAFPEQIQKSALKDNKGLMMKQMLESVKKSYECFIDEEDLLRKITKELQNKAHYIQIVQHLIINSSNLIKEIEQTINSIKKQNEDHPDIICGFRPTLSQASYTRILCYDREIYAFFPGLIQEAAEAIRTMIKIWMDLQTRRASFIRIKILLSKEKIDIVALLRETGSPRQEILKKDYWVCFEAEMKIQVWPSQLQTYKNLMQRSKEGPFCQLNMGEGKTQVIIPMIILNSIFSKHQTLPRINLLSSLYEEARGNMFRFLSVTGFQIPGFQIPFNRKVKLTKHNIYATRNLINCFSGILYVLVKRQSRLSEILSFNQMALIKKKHLKPKKGQKLDKITHDETALLDCPIFDIFDQIDAMMTPKKSYIFSIGDKCELPSSNLRFDILNECIEVFLTKGFKELLKQKLVTTDITDEDALKTIDKGELPSGLRLLIENMSVANKRQLKQKLVLAILKNSKKHEYSFVSNLDEKQIKQLAAYCVDPHVKPRSFSAKISQASFNQIFILRGVFAYGIFEHCLSKRCGVDYGVPGPDHVKTIAVPYEAADIPSKSSQYQHPQVSTILSYLAYQTRGLTMQQFIQCLQTLLNLTDTSRQIEYSMWVDILNAETKKNLTNPTNPTNPAIDKAFKINIKSQQHRKILYDIFKKNRKTVAFWLIKCVFPIDLVQFKENICSSSFDLADVSESIGFSGTMDNHWILPNKIKYTPCQTPSIKGTDGKMIYLILNYTKEICAIVENEKPLWQRFIQLALEKKTGCVLDVGAICVGRSLKDQIVPWVANHPLFDNKKYFGISFCDENGKWQVYDIEAQYYINRGTTIPDHQTFVIFDQARTRGADLKMDTNVVAALSLGPDLTKDKLMQAAGRLRKLGRNQTIVLLANHEVFSQIPGFPKQLKEIDKKLTTTPIKDLLPLILSWTLKNSIHENENLLLQYMNLGWKYVHSKVNNLPHRQQISAELKQKYQQELSAKIVADLSQAIFDKKPQLDKDHPTGKHIYNVLAKYGKNVSKQAGALDDVCEREVEVEIQQQKIQQNYFYPLVTIPEVQKPTIQTQIKSLFYVFEQNFKMTSNFLNTTKYQDPKKAGAGSGSGNELSQSYFVKYSEKQLTMISLREASLFIKQNILKDAKRTQEIALLESLTLQNQNIKKYKLEQALVEAKFVAGYQNYKDDEIKYLDKFFLRTLKAKFKTQEEKKNAIEGLVSEVLKIRHTYRLKYRGSTLEKMVTRIMNEKSL